MANTAVYDQADVIMTDQSGCSKSVALREDGNTLYRQGKMYEGKPKIYISLATLHSNIQNAEQRTNCTRKPQIWIQLIQLYCPMLQQRFTK